MWKTVCVFKNKENRNKRNQAWLLNNENILELGGGPYVKLKLLAHIIFILPPNSKICGHFHHFPFYFSNAVESGECRNIFGEIISEELRDRV